jgi:hypothetical protein
MDDRMRGAVDSFTAAMSCLAVFIRAKIAEDLQTAQAATPGPWVWDGDSVDAPGDRTDYIACYRYIGWDGDDREGVLPVNGQHIARHGPDRILGQCGALSDLLDELERIAERSSDPDARITARSAMGRMALVWLTVDELDAKMIDWGATDG